MYDRKEMAYGQTHKSLDAGSWGKGWWTGSIHNQDVRSNTRHNIMALQTFPLKFTPLLVA